MSTRCNIILKDKYDKILFYRHSDGYPESVIPSLSIFMKWLQEGKIRSNAEQCSGWIIALGIKEYSSDEYGNFSNPLEPVKTWKIGAYEICTSIHGDIEYLYTIDLEKLTIKIEVPIYNKEYRITGYKKIDLIDFSSVDKRPIFNGEKL